MTRILFFLLTAGSTLSISAQSGDIYHVSSETLHLRSEASVTSEVIHKLNQYDNLTLLEKKKGKQWVKVRFKQNVGFVSTQLISEGKAVVTIQKVRSGATCRDGSSSKATGRGACSHHGGVKTWRYREERRVSIITNN